MEYRIVKIKYRGMFESGITYEVIAKSSEGEEVSIHSCETKEEAEEFLKSGNADEEAAEGFAEKLHDHLKYARMHFNDYGRELGFLDCDCGEDDDYDDDD